MSRAHERGSPEVWKEVFEGSDTEYSKTPRTQNQLFEHLKIDSLQQIFPKGKAKMLEVGCGAAFVSLFFSKVGYEVTCVDINKEILEIAKSNFRKETAKGNFVLADAERLPFDDNKFDVVSSFGLLEHFKDPTKAIFEMIRVLKNRGVFFADIVPNRFSCQTAGNIFNFFVTFVFWMLHANPDVGWNKAKRNFRPLYFENSLSWMQYKKIMESAGIKNIKVRGNRPFPRLTFPPVLDKLYALILRQLTPFWKEFDSWDNPIPRFWGAGLWFWGSKGE